MPFGNPALRSGRAAVLGGSPRAVQARAFAAGHTNLLLDSMISLLPMARSGKVRPIAITSAKRSAQAPEIPTFRESGLPQFAFESWYGVWAPRDTPADRVAALNAAINQATSELARSDALVKLGIEPVTETAAQFKAYIAAEVKKGAELLKEAGLRPE